MWKKTRLAAVPLTVILIVIGGSTMEENKMLKVTIDGSEYAYPYGTPYKIIAADFQTRYPSDILLVNRDGKLCELHKVLDRDCSLKMITAQTKPGDRKSVV